MPEMRPGGPVAKLQSPGYGRDSGAAAGSCSLGLNCLIAKYVLNFGAPG